MKVYLTNLNESWIVDRLRDEWYQHNTSISVDSIKQAEIIWIIAPWLWKKIRKKHLHDKKVVCSIYHLEDKDFEHKQVRDFKKRDCFVDVYHVISLKTKKEAKITKILITGIILNVNSNLLDNCSILLFL